MARFAPGSASQPSSEVELTISCRNLIDADVFSKSDPMCVTYMKTLLDSEWQEISRTETIMNTLNPDFVTKIHLQYWFEEQQLLKFAVYDIDAESSNLKDHDFLGNCECTLGQVVAAGRLKMTLRGVSKGELIINVEEMTDCRDEVTLQFCGQGLDRKDWFGLSDPFLEFHKVGEDGSYLLVHRTEVHKWTLNPVWKPFTVPVRSMCGGDMQRTIMVLCYDWNRNGSHSLIGELFVTLEDLSVGPGEPTTFLCIHPDKKTRKPSYKHSGIIRLLHYKFQKVYSFLEYIRGGLELNCTISIDFTASNGDPRSADSLHYISHHRANQYEQALSAVGEIIQDYSSDRLFPVLGFGARLPPDGRVSHNFNVNMNQHNPHCEGVPGVLQAYKSCIQQIQLYGPTNFSPIINHVASFARISNNKYFILLIITDGIITDMPQTTKAIVQASTLPISIIIVGVGNADFGAMDVLDADTIPLVHEGVQAARDIVQFVPFRNFQRHSNINQAKAYLAKEVLMEIPDQIVSFMKSRNIKPKPPVIHNNSESPPPSYNEI